MEGLELSMRRKYVVCVRGCRFGKENGKVDSLNLHNDRSKTKDDRSQSFLTFPSRMLCKQRLFKAGNFVRLGNVQRRLTALTDVLKSIPSQTQQHRREAMYHNVDLAILEGVVLTLRSKIIPR